MDRQKIPVAVLGATGSVGQRFVSLLATHPWFEIGALTASDRSAGRPYGEVVRWLQVTPLPPELAMMPVQATVPPLDCRVVFSALDSKVAGPLEADFAHHGHVVVSNARNHRLDPDVPLLVPEVNAEHVSLIRGQSFGGGHIITNPNCSTIGLVLALKPLVDAFGVTAVHVVTLQALSGAGFPGLSSLEIADNVIPFIGGEEEKLEHETLKVLGDLRDGLVAPASITVSAQCNRVAVLDGHTECVSVALKNDPTLDDVRTAWEEFSADPQVLQLPSAPVPPIRYTTADDHPQPRLHRDAGGGMAVSIGRLRRCSILDFKFVALSHNTVRGAAGGAILCAELVVATRVVEGLAPPLSDAA